MRRHRASVTTCAVAMRLLWCKESNLTPALFLCQDDLKLENFNVQERVNTFVATAKAQAANYPTNHIMFLMGGDFQWQNANRWYKNLDKLITYANRMVFYQKISSECIRFSKATSTSSTRHRTVTSRDCWHRKRIFRGLPHQYPVFFGRLSK